MGWSLSLKNPPDFSMVDATLLAIGKAVYLANAFEDKCRYILRMANNVAYINSHPGSSFSEMLASMVRDQKLKKTIDALVRSLHVTEDEAEALDWAREARNFIAHEGAGAQFGYVYDATDSRMRDHLDRLRPQVANLAAGDNVVSRWVYEIDEGSSAPAGLVAAYPSMVDRWVFGHLESSIWQPIPEAPSLTDRLTRGRPRR